MGRNVGKYQLVAKLASGGMGQIFIARQGGPGGFDRFVVIKQLLPHLAHRERAVAMFLEEAAVASRVRHPNVCQVHEFGVADDGHYLVMEYLEGVTLSECARALDGADDADDVRLIGGLLQQACDGLHSIHTATNPDGAAAGIVHRDVSPQNLFVTTNGVVKVLDLGIAKRDGSTIKTQTGTLLGKIAYLSPEQIRGLKSTVRSDLFALASVGFELVCGSPAFARDNDYETMRAITEGPSPVGPTVGPAARFSAELARGLARAPEGRFASALEMGRAISNACGPHGPSGATKIAEWVEANFGAGIRERRRRLREATGSGSGPEWQDDVTKPSRLGPEAPNSQTTIVPLTADERATALRSWRTETVIRKTPEGSQATKRPTSRLWSLFLVAIGASAVGVAWLASRSYSASSDTRSNDASANAAMVFDAGAGTSPTVDASAQQPSETAASRRPAKPKHAARDRRPGFVTLVSKPYARVYLNGRRVGVTPLIRFKVTPGRYRVRAVTEDGRVQSFRIRVEPGEESIKRRLKW